MNIKREGERIFFLSNLIRNGQGVVHCGENL